MILKSELKPGTVLIHQHLDVVEYTDLCQFLEVGYGNPDTLYVYDFLDQEVKEVTLALLSYRHLTK